ncbi:MAG: NADH:flavin oxidoreductase [bacterium]|nr:NADH:flavin oxidoreductase [bacterium]
MTLRPDILFSPLALRHITLPNRFVRSATYEGWGDVQGVPRPELGELYLALARGGVGTIVTGFAFISRQGRAMQPGQCGMDQDDKTGPWAHIVTRVRDEGRGTRLFMQIAHTGRQTLSRITGQPVVGASSRRCTYFRQPVRMLGDDELRVIVNDFACAAYRARQAGFDGVQVHAGHGYLIHQFLSPWTNTRKDRWAEPTLLLQEVIIAIRRKCGDDFPILVKISAGEDTVPGLGVDDALQTVVCLEALSVDAVEVSYGTMEYALNIMRGGIPVDVALQVNPLYNRYPALVRHMWKRFCFPAYQAGIIPFAEEYNVPAAVRIKRQSSLPVIPVGGMRTLESMLDCITTRGLDAVALCRPLICQPNLPQQIAAGEFSRSRCINCNLCTVYCDSDRPLYCHL